LAVRTPGPLPTVQAARAAQIPIDMRMRADETQARTDRLRVGFKAPPMSRSIDPRRTGASRPGNSPVPSPIARRREASRYESVTG
jgi:hypothetical protein